MLPLSHLITVRRGLDYLKNYSHGNYSLFTVDDMMHAYAGAIIPDVLKYIRKEESLNGKPSLEGHIDETIEFYQREKLQAGINPLKESLAFGLLTHAFADFLVPYYDSLKETKKNPTIPFDDEIISYYDLIKSFTLDSNLKRNGVVPSYAFKGGLELYCWENNPVSEDFCSQLKNYVSELIINYFNINKLSPEKINTYVNNWFDLSFKKRSADELKNALTKNLQDQGHSLSEEMIREGLEWMQNLEAKTGEPEIFKGSAKISVDFFLNKTS